MKRVFPLEEAQAAAQSRNVRSRLGQQQVKAPAAQPPNRSRCFEDTGAGASGGGGGSSPPATLPGAAVTSAAGAAEHFLDAGKAVRLRRVRPRTTFTEAEDLALLGYVERWLVHHPREAGVTPACWQQLCTDPAVSVGRGRRAADVCRRYCTLLGHWADHAAFLQRRGAGAAATEVPHPVAAVERRGAMAVPAPVSEATATAVVVPATRHAEQRLAQHLGPGTGARAVVHCQHQGQPSSVAQHVAPAPPAPPNNDYTPVHWSTATDPAGHVYWWHTVTKAVQWLRPSQSQDETPECALPSASGGGAGTHAGAVCDTTLSLAGQVSSAVPTPEACMCTVAAAAKTPAPDSRGSARTITAEPTPGVNAGPDHLGNRTHDATAPQSPPRRCLLHVAHTEHGGHAAGSEAEEALGAQEAPETRLRPAGATTAEALAYAS